MHSTDTIQHDPLLEKKSQHKHVVTNSDLIEEKEIEWESPRRPKVRLRTLSPLLLPAFLILCVVTVFAGYHWAEPYKQTLSPYVEEYFRFNETTWLERQAYYTMVSHAFFHRRAEELLYSVLGILLFGWLVQRNIGFWRTLFLFLFAAAMSVGVWRFILTPFGSRVLDDMVSKVFLYLAEHHDLGTAFMALEAYSACYQRLIAMQGPLCGAAGAVAGLMMFMLCRRTLYTSRVPIRWLTLLLVVGYTAVGWAYLYPVVLKVPVPYLWWIGGAVGGLIFCMPDKALAHLKGSFANAAVSAAVERGR